MAHGGIPGHFRRSCRTPPDGRTPTVIQPWDLDQQHSAGNDDRPMLGRTEQQLLGDQAAGQGSEGSGSSDPMDRRRRPAPTRCYWTLALDTT